MQQYSPLLDRPLFHRTPSYLEALNEAAFCLTQIQARTTETPGTVTAMRVNNNTNQPLVTVTEGGCPGKQINATNDEDPKLEVYDRNPFEERTTVNQNGTISNAGVSPVNVEEISDSLCAAAFHIDL